MGLIEVKQSNVAQINSLKSKWRSGLRIPENPPKILWVVYEGEQIVGIFADWEEASSLVGGLFRAQQTKMFLREKERENEKKNPDITRTPGS
ncbi:hypothetical protein F0170_16695 [Pseudomonas sp. MAFF 730085]|uniref:Uncharacterized protein n=1 Tax=Pseudomonas kitaguniensis TaxID=2607908 RepID=A0A5N7JVV2_9PSED|nr:hypothetical protein [Pseudomonas kitaguniensis]MPQ85485.1 hypothetical protein [Pseudomonas kitaguniensis]